MLVMATSVFPIDVILSSLGWRVVVRTLLSPCCRLTLPRTELPTSRAVLPRQGAHTSRHTSCLVCLRVLKLWDRHDFGVFI